MSDFLSGALKTIFITQSFIINMLFLQTLYIDTQFLLPLSLFGSKLVKMKTWISLMFAVNYNIKVFFYSHQFSVPKQQ